jgi:hypothetical protein
VLLPGREDEAMTDPIKDDAMAETTAQHPVLAYLEAIFAEAETVLAALDDSPETITALRHEGIVKQGMTECIAHDRAVLDEHVRIDPQHCRVCWGPQRWPCWRLIQVATFWGWTTGDPYEAQLVAMARYRGNAKALEAMKVVLVAQQQRGAESHDE